MTSTTHLSRRFILPLTALLLPPAVRADVTKASNTTALNLPGSYVENVVPGVDDIIRYTNVVTAANSTALGGSLSVLGLEIANPTGAVTITATAGATLTLGGSGINMGAATQDLTISAALALGTAQTWTVQTGRTLTVSSALAAGGHELTFAGVGTRRGGTNNAFGTGTLNLASNQTIATNDGTARSFGNTLVNIGGDITFGQGSGGTGAVTFNGANAVFDLGAATRTLTTTQNTTLTGIVQSSTPGVGITKAGANALILNGASTYSGATTINAGSLRISNDLAATLQNSNVVFNGANTYLHASVANVAVQLGTGAGQLQFGAFASGFGAVGANATFTVNGGAPLTWGDPSFVQNNQQLLFGGTQSNQTATLANALNLGGHGGATSGSLRTISPADSGGAFEGNLTGAITGPSGLILGGTGALRLSGSVGHEGGTFVNSGILGFDANLSAPANLSTGAIGPITNLSGGTTGAVAYTGTATTIPAEFYESLANLGSAITVAAFGTNNGSGNYTTSVNFNDAPAAMRSKLYLGGTAASTTQATVGVTNFTGTLTPVDGTYRLGGGNGVLAFTTANQLTGANNVVVRPGGLVRVTNAAQNLTGTITINGGIFELNNNGANISTAAGIIVNGVGNLVNATSVNGYGHSTTFFAKLRTGGIFGLQFMKDPTGALVGDQLVTLRGGTLAAHDNDSTSGTILVRNVLADYGYTQIAHQPQGAGTSHDELTITNLSRNFSATTEFRSTFNVLATATGDNGNINVTNINGVAAANTNNIIGGWALATEQTSATANNLDARNFATLTANGVDAYVQEYTTGAANLLSAAATTANVLVTGTTGGTASAHNAISANKTVNSMITEAAIDVTGSAVLTIGSGGLIMRQTQNFLGSSDNTGKLTTGLASGELFLYNDPLTNGDHRITSLAIADNGLTPVHVIKGGTGTITLGGITQSNTFSGGIVVNLGALRIDYRGSGTVLPSGPGNTITVRSGGTFATALNNGDPRTVTNNIFLDGGTLTNENTGGGTASTVTHNGTITATSVPGSTAFINSNATNAEMILGSSSTLTGTGNLTKIGARALDIQTANTSGFTGNIYINAGILQASGAGVLPETDYFLTGGTLGMTTTNQTIRNLAGTGGIINGATGGSDSLTVVQTEDAAYHGQISQTLLVKQGSAHLYLSGATDNSTAFVQLDEGVLTLAKASTNVVHVIGSAGLGLTVNGGTLRLGGNFTDIGGTGAPNVPPASAPANYVDQIFYQTEVLLNGGTFDLSGLSESVDGLSGAAPAVITNDIAATTSTFFTGQANTGGDFAGTMQDGAGQLAYVKLGNGTQTLSGTNTYTGPTEVRGGTLEVTGSLSGSVVTVRDTARLNAAAIGGLLTEAGATVAPGGAALASLAIGGDATLGGGTLELTLNGPVAGSGYDRLTVGGALDLTGDTTLVLTLGFTPTPFVDTFTLIRHDGPDPIGGTGLFVVNGTPLNDGDIFDLSGSQFRIQYDGNDGNDILLETVPEPGSAALVLGGLALLLGSRRPRRKG